MDVCLMRGVCALTRMPHPYNFFVSDPFPAISISHGCKYGRDALPQQKMGSGTDPITGMLSSHLLLAMFHRNLELHEWRPEKLTHRLSQIANAIYCRPLLNPFAEVTCFLMRHTKWNIAHKNHQLGKSIWINTIERTIRPLCGNCYKSRRVLFLDVGATA